MPGSFFELISRDRLPDGALDLTFDAGNNIVIGAGAMGGDIAAWCAGQDLRVTLADMKPEPPPMPRPPRSILMWSA